jgi:hypothetical protein
MKYDYNGIILGDSIEKIIDFLSEDKIELDWLHTGNLIYKPGSKVGNIETKIFINLYYGIVGMMKIFDKKFYIEKDLKIGQVVTQEIIDKYGLYIGEDDDESLSSKKYKELVICIDWDKSGNKNEYKEWIIGYNFTKSIGTPFENQIEDYLKCKNYREITGYLWKNRKWSISLKRKELIGYIENYEFVFDLITRNVKSIRNTISTVKYVYRK